MMSGTIGVVVPTLNSAAALDWTLLSLRRQQSCDLRIIVADSGSDDGTLEICARWEAPTLYVERGNMYRAINAGLRTFDTEWLTYLNSDDIVYPDAYARLMARGATTTADIVYGHSDYMDFQGRFFYSYQAASVPLLRPLMRSHLLGFVQTATIFRTDLFRRLGGFDESYRYASDYDFFARATARDARFARLSAPAVSSFRLHRQQLSYTMDEALRGEVERSAAAILSPPKWGDHMAVLLWRGANLPHYAIRVLRNHTLRLWPSA